MANAVCRVLIFASALFFTACGAPQMAKEPQAASQQTALPPSDMTPTMFPHDPPATCPITRPPSAPFTPPPPYPAAPPSRYAGQFWYGTPDLWTMLGADGIWASLPHNEAGYTQKVFWWREGYDPGTEPNPRLTVTGRRLDASAPPLVASGATNASADFGQAMLVGVDIPTLGCWEITGRYDGHELSFTVWVAP